MQFPDANLSELCLIVIYNESGDSFGMDDGFWVVLS